MEHAEIYLTYHNHQTIGPCPLKCMRAAVAAGRNRTRTRQYIVTSSAAVYYLLYEVTLFQSIFGLESAFYICQKCDRASKQKFYSVVRKSWAAALPASRATVVFISTAVIRELNSLPSPHEAALLHSSVPAPYLLGLVNVVRHNWKREFHLTRGLEQEFLKQQSFLAPKQRE